MDGIFIVVCATIFLGAFVWALRSPSNWQRLVFQAAKDQQIEPLVDELSKRPPLVQPRFYDEAMEYLYSHNPEVAIRFTMVFVPKFPEHKLSQKWLAMVKMVEPRWPLLTSEFLEQYTRSNCTTGVG
jgi:hypothetical protein